MMKRFLVFALIEQSSKDDRQVSKDLATQETYYQHILENSTPNLGKFWKCNKPTLLQQIYNKP